MPGFHGQYFFDKTHEKVQQVGNDQEMKNQKKNSHSKTRVGLSQKICSCKLNSLSNICDKGERAK